MNYIDIAIIIGVLIGICLGLITGLVKQIAGIVALTAGVVVAIIFTPAFAEGLGRWIENKHVATMAASLGLFSLASMTVRIIAVLFSHFLKKAELNKVDRALGGVIGAAKAVIVGAVIVTVVGRHGSEGTRTEVDNSIFGALTVGAVDLIAGKADEYDVTEKLKDSLKRGKKAAGELQEKGKQLVRGKLGKDLNLKPDDNKSGTSQNSPKNNITEQSEKTNAETEKNNE